MVAPPLPTELVHAIVDELAHERDALRACSVLSRQWLVAAQRRIFEECVFIGESGGEPLGLDSPYHRKLRAFTEFLEREAYVCGYFKTLALSWKLVDRTPEESGAGTEKHDSRPQDLVYHVDAGLLLQVLGQMPMLETLELWMVYVEPPTAPAGDSAPPLSPILNIRRLGLHYIPLHASDLVHIPYIFTLLPNLSDMYTTNCTFGRKHYLLRDGTERRKMLLPSGSINCPPQHRATGSHHGTCETYTNPVLFDR